MRIYRYGSTIAVMLSNKVKYNNVVLAAYVVFVNVNMHKPNAEKNHRKFFT